MSDTDRTGASSQTGAAKSTSRRGRAAGKAESPRSAGDPSSVAGASEGAPAATGDPGKAESAVPAAETFGREPLPTSGAPDATPPVGQERGATASSEDMRPSARLDAPEPPAEEKALSPWRHVGHEVPPGLSPPSGGRSARALAIAALLLSLILPAGLCAYLAAIGIFDHMPERLAQAESTIAALRATPAPRPEVARADLDKVAARIEGIEKAIATQGQRPATSAALESLSGKIEAASRDAKDALSVAKSAADSANGAQSAAARLANVESKLVTLEKELATLEQSITGRSRQDANAPSILVMARAIEVDLNRGVAYAGELDALSRLGADAKLVEALRPFAEKGAPSPASLAGDFENELQAARERVAEAAQPANWWDRLLSFVGRIVRVRHIGVEEAGSPAGRVEAALLRGDIAAARDAWDALPVFEKSATPRSGARVKALADAYEGSRKISMTALEAIRRSSTTDNGG